VAFYSVGEHAGEALALPRSNRDGAGGPGVAGDSGGHTVGADVPCAPHVVWEKGRLGGLGSNLSTRAISGGATSEGVGWRGGPNAEMAVAPRGGARGRALERGHDDSA
jgi:hypothetical protein